MKKVRRLLSVILMVCVVLSLLPATAWAAMPPPVTGTEWTLDAGTLTITSDTGMNDWLTSMDGASSNGDNVSSVVFVGDVKVISDNAFQNRTNITSLTIGNSVTTIGANAFYSCSGITSLSIPNSVTTIGNAAFYQCFGITSALVIPASVTSIGAYAFNCCLGIPSLTLPNTAISIGEYAFSGTGITSLTIPASMTSIGDNAFFGLDGLVNLTIPDTVTAIGKGAFSNNILASVTIPASVTSIGDNAFDNSALVNVIFLGTTRPSTVGSGVFETLYLNGIYVPAGCEVEYGALSSYAPICTKTVCITENSVTTYYPTLTSALAAAADGDTITLLSNITESVSYTVTAGKTVTIDGGGFKLTAPDSNTLSVALTLSGTGTVILKNLTLQGGASTNANSEGLDVSGSVSVQSYGTVTANGGAAGTSCGLVNNGTGSVDVTTAASATGCMVGHGVQNNGSGTVNVITATGNCTGILAIGVSNSSGGIVNVYEATGNNYGVYNTGGGTVNVTKDVSTTGVFNMSGTVNAGTIMSSAMGLGTINTGTSVAAITLSKGTGATCVLDSITVASTGTTIIGKLPSVYKNGTFSNNWYTDSAKNTLFSGNSVTGAATLYSYFYTAPTTPSGGGGGGGGGGTVAVSGAITTTTGNKVAATVAATATIGANGSAAATVTGTQVTDAIDKAVKGAASHGAGTEALVEIKVEGAGSANSVSTTIPQSAWSELSGSSADGLRISTPLASVTFDAAALDAIKGKAAGDIKITAALADTSGLTGAEKEVVAGRPVYDLTVASGSTTISDFGGGSATVSIPYKLSAGEDAGKIVIYYLTDSGELAMVQNCSYDAATGKVTFIAKHFSNYVVGYNNVSFSDVSGWYKDYVNYLAAREIISGTGNGTFNPNTNITRAQFVMILANLSGADLSGYTTSSFNDVSKTAWYSAAVQWAYAEGIATGAGGKFDPNANITRQDMAVMIMRYAEKAADYTLPATNKAITFTDSKDIGSYASDAVAAMQQAGIISGNSDGSFAPAANASRAQAAKMIALLQQGMMK